MTATINGATIRRLSIDEAGVFRDIRLEALSSEPSSFASLHEDWISRPEEDWHQRLEQPVFVAFLNDKPCGTMTLIFHQARKMMHRATLTSVYVRGSKRGKGIATGLLRVVASHARELGILQLELGVTAENTNAIRFYLGQGFETIGRIPRGFRDDDTASDEVLMVLLLENDPVYGMCLACDALTTRRARAMMHKLRPVGSFGVAADLVFLLATVPESRNPAFPIGCIYVMVRAVGLLGQPLPRIHIAKC